MNEFLKNLRNQQKDKFGASSYRSSDKQSYPHPDRRSGNDRRSHTSVSRSSANVDHLAKKITELIPEVKSLMVAVTDTNDRLVDVMDRFVDVEEKRNEIYASMAESMAALAKNGLISDLSGGLDNEYKKTKKIPREERDKIRDLIYSMREKGSTYEQIAEYLETEKIPTFSNKGHWHAQTIHRLYQQRKSELEV